MVGDDDPVDPGIGREPGVLGGQNALQHQLHLDPVAQALDRVPCQVGDGRAADAAELDTGKIRLAAQIIRQAVATAAIARVGAAQADKGLPLRRRSHIERYRNRRRARALGPLHQRFGDLPFLRGVELKPDRRPARGDRILDRSRGHRREDLQMVAQPGGLGDGDLRVGVKGPVAAGRRDTIGLSNFAPKISTLMSTLLTSTSRRGRNSNFWKPSRLARNVISSSTPVAM